MEKAVGENPALPIFLYRLLVSVVCASLHVALVAESRLASWASYFFVTMVALFATGEIFALLRRAKRRRAVVCAEGTLWLTLHLVAVQVSGLTNSGLPPEDFRAGIGALLTGALPIGAGQGLFLVGWSTATFAASWFALKLLERLPRVSAFERLIRPTFVVLCSALLLAMWFQAYLFPPQTFLDRTLLRAVGTDKGSDSASAEFDWESHVSNIGASLSEIGARKSLEVKARKRPHLLFVHIESLRWDHFSDRLFSKTRPLLHDCYQSPRHYSTGNTTSNAITGVLTGLSALYAEQIRRRPIAPLPLRALREIGYEQHVWFPNRTLHFDNLLDDLFGPHFKVHQVQGSDRAALDEKIVEQFTSLVPGTQPRFDYVVLDASHYDYAYPESFERFTPAGRLSFGFNPLTGEGANVPADGVTAEMRAGLKNRYLNSLLYVDSILARLVEAVASREIETWMVLFGDHGEALWDDEGRFGHRSALSDQQTRVPLVFCGPPNVTSHAKISSHEDIFPTVFSQMGLRAVVPFMSGSDLFATSHDRTFSLARMPVSSVDASKAFAVFGPEMRARFVLGQQLTITKVDSDFSGTLERSQASSLVLQSLGAARLTAPPTH